MDRLDNHIRTLLRAAKVPLINTSVPHETPAGFKTGLGARDLDDSLERLATDCPAPHRVTHFTDLLDCILRDLDHRLQDFQRQFEIGLPETLEQTLLLVLLENRLMEFDGLTLDEALVNWLRAAKDRLQNEGLSETDFAHLLAAVAMQKNREAIDIVTRTATGATAAEFCAQIGESFSISFHDLSVKKVSAYQKENRPLQFWFDTDPSGPLMYLIYYSKRCSFLQCYGCALPSISAKKAVRSTDLFEQTDYLLNHLLTEQEKRTLKTVILSNNGSMFDESTFSRTALHHAVARLMSELPQLERISFESRAEFLRPESLSGLRDLRAEYGSRVTLELALGVEVHDEKRRNKITRKGLTNRAIQKCIEVLGTYGFELRCYFMLKPHPTMSEADAYADIENGLKMLDDFGQENQTRIIMHLNPTYVARGTALEDAFLAGSYTPPALEPLVDFVQRHNQRHTELHIGLSDEGLAVPGGSFLKPESEKALAALRQHNQTRVEKRKVPSSDLLPA